MKDKELRKALSEAKIINSIDLFMLDIVHPLLTRDDIKNSIDKLNDKITALAEHLGVVFEDCPSKLRVKAAPVQQTTPAVCHANAQHTA